MSKLFIATLALLIVSSIFYVLFIYHPMEQFDKVDIANLPVIDYCDIRNSPAKYDGKVVKITGQMGDFMHGRFFQDPACKEKYYEELSDDSRTAIRFFPPNSKKIEAKYRILRGNPDKPWELTGVTAVGRFNHQYPTRSDDSISQRTSFHFEIFSLAPGNQ